MVHIILDASCLSKQQRIDYAADLDRNLGIADLCQDNPLHISLYTDHPEQLFPLPGVTVLSRLG